VTAVSHPNRLMPQHIALYRSAAEKWTIKRSDSTQQYQLPVWRGVITRIVNAHNHTEATADMHAPHSFGRLTKKVPVNL
jgi:hypothetical protein